MLPLQKRRYQRVWLKVRAVAVSSQAGSVMNSCGNCTSRPLWGSTWHRPLNCWQAQLVGWIWTHGIWAQCRCTSYKRESRSPLTFDDSPCLAWGYWECRWWACTIHNVFHSSPFITVFPEFFRALFPTLGSPEMPNHRVDPLLYGYDLEWQMMIRNDKKTGNHDASNPIENPGNSKYLGEKWMAGQSINQ